ncbi:MAG: tRNA (adenosine(37)-N6)-threonylcarbamoyltransferase complex ATPase subunit type 1 TsaE [Candidatus Margulisbacteria bacterium]|nr:tRNA (adenosine(37)-N6)-threonylcarbamoyltransferase complex ATPase subunit type 1 TsaE [Candidatus Margulisiibacteriota bacterium]
MMKLFDVHSLDEFSRFSEWVSQQLRPGDRVLLSGDMGSGKTTFVAQVAKFLHSRSLVTSPTFTLIQRYEADLPLVHMDLYRLESEQSLLGLDIEAYLSDPRTVVFIEWPERLGRLRPEDFLKIEFSYLPAFSEYRKISVLGAGERWNVNLELFKI